MIEEEVPQPREPVFGDNSGSMLIAAKSEQGEALHDTVREGRTFAQRRAEFFASAAKQTVVDRRSAADAADTIKLAQEVWALIDADRKARSEPFRTVHLALSAMASEFWEPVNEKMQGLREQIDTWSDEEDARIARRQKEQSDQLAAMRGGAVTAPVPAPTPSVPSTPPSGRYEIDYAAPAAPITTKVLPVAPARRAKIRGDLGATISQRDIVRYEIEDISMIPDHIMQSPTVVEAILTVVRSTARHMGVPKGIRVRTETGNQIK